MIKNEEQNRSFYFLTMSGYVHVVWMVTETAWPHGNAFHHSRLMEAQDGTALHTWGPSLFLTSDAVREYIARGAELHAQMDEPYEVIDLTIAL